MSHSPPNPFWRHALLLFLALLALSAPQAALLPLLDRDEPRFAEASREMLQSGDFIVPTFNHAPRYAKPPLIYWCQDLSFTLLGQNAFAARLPSLLATAATALILFTWGLRLADENTGLIAALSYAFCFQTLQQGRVATADALLIFFMTLTAFAGWRILQPKASGRPRAICFIVLALGFAGGFLAKGPEALLPFLPLLWCARRQGGAVIAGLILSLLAGLAIVLFWAIPAYIETHGDYWKVGLGHDVIDRMAGGDFQGHGASTLLGYLLLLPLYLLLFWPSALPWSPLLVIRRKKLFAAWKPDPTDIYLLLNAGLIFCVFSLMATKLPHYTLPAFPFLALLFGRRWISSGLNPALPIKLGWIAGIVFALLAAIFVPVAIANDATPSPVGELVHDAEFRPPIQIEQVISPHAGTPPLGMPPGTLTEDSAFALVDFQEPNAIWEIRRVTTGYPQTIPPSDVISFLYQPGPHAVLLSTSLWQRIDRDERDFQIGSSPWKTFEARGFNAAKGNFIDLTLVVKP